MNAESRSALFLLLAAALLWSTGGVLIKWVNLPPLAIVGARSAIAVVALIAMAGWPRPPYSRVQWLGAFCYAAAITFFVTSTKWTTAANAILLQYTAPVHVALLSGPFLGERLKRIDWIALIAVMAGMVLFFADTLDIGGWWGNIFGLISGIFLAGMVVCLRAQKNASPHGSLIFGNVLAAGIGLPFLTTAGMTSGTWAALLFLGVVQIGLAYYCYGWAIKRVSALEGILVPTLEPILNPIWVFLFLGEIPGPWAMTGGAVIVTTLAWRGWNENRSEQRMN